MIPAPDPQYDAPTIIIIDDEVSIRTALKRLVRAAGLRALAYESVADLLQQSNIPTNSCIISDICMPGSGGLELPRLLANRGLKLPVIYVTAYDSGQIRAEAKRAGAVGYFRKPVDDHALLDAIQWALREPEQPNTDVK
jgi:FixJ family two-component response regulator